MKRTFKRIISLLMGFVITASMMEVSSNIIASAEDVSNLNPVDSTFSFIKSVEGYSSECFWDVAQWTIGYGNKCPYTHTSNGVRGQKGGHTISESKARELFNSKLSGYVNILKSNCKGLSMTQNQFDALLSATYNHGNVNNCPLKYYLQGKLNEENARAQYSEWCINKGTADEKGLRNRRKKEADLFFSGDRKKIDTPIDSSYSVPWSGQPKATSGLITVYNVYGEPYSTSVHNIAYNDNCTVHEVYGSGFCKVTYPVSGETHTEYAKTSDFDIPKKSSAGKPGTSYIHVGAGTHYTKSVIWWEKSSDTTSYDVKIWSGKLWEGEPYKVLWNQTDNFEWVIELPEGHYEAYVDSNNSNGTTISDVIKFDVGKGNPVDVGTDFYAYIINTKSWKGIKNDSDNVSFRSKTIDGKESREIWQFKRNSDGSYKIISCYDGKAIDVDGGKSENKTNIQVWESNDSDAQKWFIYGESAAYYFKPACSDRVLDMDSGEFYEGVNAQLWDKNNTDAQKMQIWKLDNYENPANLGNEFDALILHKKHWKPLMIQNSIKDGSKVILGTENQTNMSREVWHFKQNSDGSYRISPYYDRDLSLDVIGGKDENGTEIGVYNSHDGANQKWYIYQGNDGYILKPGCSSTRVLDLYDNQKNDGTILEIYDRHGEESQIFSFWKFDSAGKSEIKATAGTESTNTKFSWTKAANATDYTVKVWKNRVSEGDVFKEFSTKDTSWNVILPEGTYQAYVDSYNTYSHSQSNVITIKVGSCQHNFSDWSITKAATCTSEGQESKSCSICGEKETRSVAKTGHKHDSKIVSSTFTEKGYTLHTCSVCGDSYKDNYTPIKITEKISEVVFLQQYFTKKCKLTDEQLAAADLNNDGTVNVFDVIILKRKIIYQSAF